MDPNFNALEFKEISVSFTTSPQSLSPRSNQVVVAPDHEWQAEHGMEE